MYRYREPNDIKLFASDTLIPHPQPSLDFLSGYSLFVFGNILQNIGIVAKYFPLFYLLPLSYENHCSLNVQPAFSTKR